MTKIQEEVTSIIEAISNVITVNPNQPNNEPLIVEFLDKVHDLILSPYGKQKFKEIKSTILKLRETAYMVIGLDDANPIYRLCQHRFVGGTSLFKGRLRSCMYMLLAQPIETDAAKEQVNKVVDMVVFPVTSMIKDIKEAQEYIKK